MKSIPARDSEPGDPADCRRQWLGRRTAGAILVAAIATCSAAAKGCGASDDLVAPCELSITNPTAEQAYATGDGTVVLGGSVSGASYVTWINETNDLSGEAYVTYVDWGVGGWFTDQIGLAVGSNRIVVGAHRNSLYGPVCIADSLIVEYAP
jgi:hypothetical protein